MNDLYKEIRKIIVKNDIVNPEKGGDIRIVSIKKLSKDIYDLVEKKKIK